jgi:hypothetical protein
VDRKSQRSSFSGLSTPVDFFVAPPYFSGGAGGGAPTLVIFFEEPLEEPLKEPYQRGPQCKQFVRTDMCRSRKERIICMYK